MVTLIVVGDETRRAALTLMLRELGASGVVSAEALCEVEALLGSDQADEVMDLVLVELEAIDEDKERFLALIEDELLVSIPVVGLVPPERLEDISALLREGLHDFLVWPPTKVDLEARVATALHLRHEMVARREAEVELERVNQELERLEITDAVTGAASLDYFYERFHNEWRRATRERQPLTLVLIDVDLFDLYNEHHGRLNGDTCLFQVSVSLTKVLKRPADLLARAAGASFVALLPNTHGQGAEYISEVMRRAVEELDLKHDGSPMKKLTVSCGALTLVPTNDEEPARALERVEAQLLEAKKGGRNRICSRVLKERPAE